MDKTTNEKQLQELVQKIIHGHQPEKIILFGSWAWGTPGPDSDADLFIIKKTDRSTREEAREIDGTLWGRTIPLDIIVYTPQSVEKGLQRGDFLIRDIITKGKVLYEKK